MTVTVTTRASQSNPLSYNQMDGNFTNLANAINNLSGAGGSNLIGHNNTTVQDILNSENLTSYSALRAYSGFNTSVYITGYSNSATPSGIAGKFIYDPTDSTSTDNGGTIIVTSSGKIFKRVFSNLVQLSWFCPDNTGVVDATSVILTFFNYCINNNKNGYIEAGTYLITEGKLVFDTGFTDKSLPMFYTAGYNNVFLKSSGTVDAPLITFSNGTATSSVGAYWRGGGIGGLTFIGATSGTQTATHGLSLRGMWEPTFGWIRGNNLKGDVVNLPQFFYSGSNPDPYAVSYASFDGIEGNSCTGFVVNNRNYLGQDSWKVFSVRAISMQSGVIYGLGSGVTYTDISAGSCMGWVLDDGCSSGATGGPPNRITLGLLEVDACQNGIRLNNTSLFNINNCRFICRYQSTISAYYPLTCVSFSDGTAPNSQNGVMNVFFRCEAGGNLGQFSKGIDFHNNGNSTGIEINYNYVDNGAIGVSDFTFISNTNNASIKISKNRSKIVVDSSDTCNVLSRGSSSTTILNTGYGTASSIVTFPTIVYSTSSAPYNTTTGYYTAQKTGLYRVHATLPLAVPSGTRIRMGVLTNSSGTINAWAGKIMYSSNANINNYEMIYDVYVVAGTQIALIADQNTASSVSCSPQLSNNEVSLCIAEI